MMSKNEYSKAVLYLERALKISVNNITVIRTLALAYDQMNLYEKAEGYSNNFIF